MLVLPLELCSHETQNEGLKNLIAERFAVPIELIQQTVQRAKRRVFVHPADLTIEEPDAEQLISCIHDPALRKAPTRGEMTVYPTAASRGPRGAEHELVLDPTRHRLQLAV